MKTNANYYLLIITNI